MSKLTEIERIRLSVETVNNLTDLKRFGLSKSKFIRNAILEKIERDLPQLLAEEKRKQNLIKCPF